MKASLIHVDDFRKVILSDMRLIDVRAPVEFDTGAMPTAINLPILNNEERHKLTHRQEGDKQP